MRIKYMCVKNIIINMVELILDSKQSKNVPIGTSICI